MWTAIIFMCIFQLQIIWISPCLALSSNNESFVGMDGDVDLKLSLAELLGPPFQVYADNCYRLTAYRNKVFHFLAITMALIKRERLLDYHVDEELLWLKTFFKATPTIRRVWILNRTPILSTSRYYAYYQDKSDSVETSYTNCLTTKQEIYAITVKHTKGGTKCPAIDVNKFDWS